MKILMKKQTLIIETYMYLQLMFRTICKSQIVFLFLQRNQNNK